ITHLALFAGQSIGYHEAPIFLWAIPMLQTLELTAKFADLSQAFNLRVGFTSSATMKYGPHVSYSTKFVPYSCYR
ncbi:mCG145532, partial [Mus musculus]